MGEEYGIYYQPELANARASSARTALIFQSASTAFWGVVAGVAWIVWPQAVGSYAPWFLAVSLGGGGLICAYFAVRWARARSDARAATGLAIGLNRDGVMIAQRWLTWPEVGSMLVKPGTWGASHSLLTTARDNAVLRVPIEVTDVMPASLDSAVRAMSGGRVWVDLSRLD